MNLSEIGEFGLIARLQKQLATRRGVRLGIGDDCAVLDVLHTPIITMDALVEGVHFRRDWTTPRALGRKSMAVNISDLAASGARPVAAFVSLAVSQNDTVEWIESLYMGFEDMAHQFDFTIAGGDTVKSLGGTMISVALIGEVLNEQRGPILRSGAQIGDVLLVSGTLGDSAAGLAALLAEKPENFGKVLLRHHEPTPRLQLMRELLESNPHAIHAALDISDGLVGDAAHMAKKSGVSIEIDADKLPLSAACRDAAKSLEQDEIKWALTGGEDYELLLAVAPQCAPEWVEQFGMTQIGSCGEGDGASLPVRVRRNGETWEESRAWTHF
jgi:thiamine-monophosphate kinase